jgi:mRNA interferase HicA
LTRLPMVDATRLIRALKRAGFVEAGQKGSHLTLWNPETKRATTIPVHRGDVKRSLLKLILKQAGLSDEELRDIM